MTTGEFWNKITVLANVFDARVVTGPMSINWIKREHRSAATLFQLGQACEIQLTQPKDLIDLKTHGFVLGLRVTLVPGATGIATIVPND